MGPGVGRSGDPRKVDVSQGPRELEAGDHMGP